MENINHGGRRKQDVEQDITTVPIIKMSQIKDHYVASEWFASILPSFATMPVNCAVGFIGWVPRPSRDTLRNPHHELIAEAMLQDEGNAREWHKQAIPAQV